MADSKASAVTGGIGTSVLPELTEKHVFTMPFQGGRFGPQRRPFWHSNVRALQGVIMSAVLKLFFDSPANFKATIRAYGHITSVKEPVQVSSK